MSFSITIRLIHVSVNSGIVLISSLSILKTQRKCSDQSEEVDRPSFLMKRTAVLDTITLMY
jgi:hypothetical protein